VAPEQPLVERLPDPYAKLPPRGEVPDDQRALAAIDATARALHYGDGPVAVMRAHPNDPWRRTLVLLLGLGGEVQAKAAWEVLSSNVLVGENLPVDVRYGVRESQGRLWGYENAKLDGAFLKRAYMAEIAWTLYRLHGAVLDAGSR
jgi:hypothetical protein